MYSPASEGLIIVKLYVPTIIMTRKGYKEFWMQKQKFRSKRKSSGI